MQTGNKFISKVNLNNLTSNNYALDVKSRQRIYQEFFKDDVCRLEEILGRDLSQWKYL